MVARAPPLSPPGPHSTQAWSASETGPGHAAGWHPGEKPFCEGPTPTPGGLLRSQESPGGARAGLWGDWRWPRQRSNPHLLTESSWACVELGGRGGPAWCGVLGGSAVQCSFSLLPMGPCPLRTGTMELRNQPPSWQCPQRVPTLGARRSVLTGSPASPFSPGRPGFPRSPWNTKQITVRGQFPVSS